MRSKASRRPAKNASRRLRSSPSASEASGTLPDSIAASDPDGLGLIPRSRVISQSAPSATTASDAMPFAPNPVTRAATITCGLSGALSIRPLPTVGRYKRQKFLPAWQAGHGPDFQAFQARDGIGILQEGRQVGTVARLEPGGDKSTAKGITGARRVDCGDGKRRGPQFTPLTAR